ncbi:MAG: type II secretion system protein [Candidatus Omnitrophica bacterium]|nr:type II secretion system protein [Candidatus Omnitrophota bacterium]
MKRGFTLIETVMVIAIIGVLSASGAFILVNILQQTIFMPNQLNMNMVAAQALDTMIEGEAVARGLRFSKSISSVGADQVVFNNQDDQSISYRLDTGTAKLYRSVDGGAEALIPYYAGTGINLSGAGGQLFSYYDSAEASTSTPADVRRVKINLVAMTGSGSYSDLEGKSEQASSVAVHKFE